MVCGAFVYIAFAVKASHYFDPSEICVVHLNLPFLHSVRKSSIDISLCMFAIILYMRYISLSVGLI